MNTKKRVERLRKIIAESWSKIEDIQNKCSHKSSVSRYKSDTGNYDPTQDRHWVEHECFICEKCWDTEK